MRFNGNENEGEGWCVLTSGGYGGSLAGRVRCKLRWHSGLQRRERGTG